MYSALHSQGNHSGWIKTQDLCIARADVLPQHTLHICSMYEEICHCLYKVRGVQDKGKKTNKLSDLSPLQI